MPYITCTCFDDGTGLAFVDWQVYSEIEQNSELFEDDDE